MASDSYFFEKTLSSSKIFSGKLLQVYKDAVELPDGHQSIREYIKHPGAAVIVPSLENGQILMVRQYRYPVHRVMLELPAGKIDPGETPEQTVKRELSEETGYQTTHLSQVCQIHTCVGYSDELLYLYWADHLKPESRQQDPDEAIEVIKISIDQALKKVHCGEITDAKTVIGLFWAEKIVKNPAILKNQKSVL
jgi:ADP-ribose pyrophosphatase